MTTQVKIENEGSENILVTSRDHRTEPKLDEPATILKPGGVIVIHVYEENSIFIRELR